MPNSVLPHLRPQQTTLKRLRRLLTTALRRILTENTFEDVADLKKWRLKMIVYEHRYKHDGGADANEGVRKMMAVTLVIWWLLAR